MHMKQNVRALSFNMQNHSSHAINKIIYDKDIRHINLLGMLNILMRSEYFEILSVESYVSKSHVWKVKRNRLDKQSNFLQTSKG